MADTFGYVTAGGVVMLIKTHRQVTGGTLKEAKAYVDKYCKHGKNDVKLRVPYGLIDMYIEAGCKRLL